MIVTSLAVLGWHVELRTADTTICAPPGGRTLAWTEVRERASPLLPFRHLVAQRADALRAEGVSALAVERAHRLITSEGELGAITTWRVGAGSKPTLGPGRCRCDCARVGFSPSVPDFGTGACAFT